MNQRIDLLPQSSYIRHVDTIFEGRHALTHAALLRVGQRTDRYYVKCYGHHAKPLFNEISGFLLAAAANLPQAKKAALIALPGEHLNKCHPGQGLDSQPHWLCWTTSAITSHYGSTLPTANAHFNQNIERIADDLKNWNGLPTLLAFDEWVANVDRNTGNLVRLAAGDYAVIDHGAILTGTDWVSEFLAPVASYANTIWTMYRSARGMPLPLSSAAMHACRKFMHAYIKELPEIRSYGEELLDPDDLSCCSDFLLKRSLRIHLQLKSRLGVLV